MNRIQEIKRDWMMGRDCDMHVPYLVATIATLKDALEVIVRESAPMGEDSVHCGIYRIATKALDKI